ncbi:Ankyrin-2 [Xylographa vitiligo]|nr:Ankyrin-2 [Xylographa vitiligo]
MSAVPSMHPADKVHGLQSSGPWTHAQLLAQQSADSPEKREALLLVEQASSSGDLQTIITLVDEHHLSSEDLQSTLAAAVRGRQVETIRYFLDRGVRIGRQAALAAAALQSLTVYKLLVQYGWNVNSPLTGGRTTLSYSSHPFPLARAFVKSGLLSKGSIVDQSPLDNRYVMDDATLVRWLLDHGADPNIGAMYTDGLSDSDPIPISGDALDRAARSACIPAFDLLLAHGARLQNSLPMHAVAATADAEAQVAMMQHLLLLGVDVNANDFPRGSHAFGTPLHYAVRHGRIAGVRFLIEHGADLTARNASNRTLIEEARSWDYPEIVELLEAAVATDRPEDSA